MNKFDLTASSGFKTGVPLAAKAATASHAEEPPFRWRPSFGAAVVNGGFYD